MGRPLRVHIPHSIHHVILRGNNKQDIFFSDVDRCKFCMFTQYGLEKFDHQIHAFCLMDNHVHFVVQVGETTLSEIMKNLAGRYATYFNERHERVGHLFQGRFKSILVDSDLYLTALVRYVHLNPVRAGMTKLPNHYKWSSHQAYLDCDEVTWLSKKTVLKHFARGKKTFYQYILDGIGKKPEANFSSGGKHGILGSEIFIKQTLNRVSGDREISNMLQNLVDRVCEQYDVTPEELRSASKQRKIANPRAMLALLAKSHPSITLKEVAEYLNRDAGSLQRLTMRYESKWHTSPSLLQQIESLNGSA